MASNLDIKNLTDLMLHKAVALKFCLIFKFQYLICILYLEQLQDNNWLSFTLNI